MSLILQIVPFNDVLDMFGEPEPMSAYSLSGHVSISVAPSFSFFESCRHPRILLQSLSLTFEGQSEVFSQSTGYSSVRLCSVTRELVPSESIELTNDGSEDSSAWNIVFNLPIPGWLPGSSAHCEEDFGVKYSLSATARFMSLDADNHVSSWNPLSALCAPFRPRFRSAESCKTVKLRRLVHPPRMEAVEIPKFNYLVNSCASSKQKTDDNKIPAAVLASIQILVSVPEYIDVKGKDFPLAIRLRTKNLCEEECEKVQLTATSLDLLQNEQFRCRPNPAYVAQFPLPPKEMQPPNKPLHDCHPMNFFYSQPFTGTSQESSSRSFSLLSSAESGRFQLAQNNYVFKDDRNETVPTWYTMNISLPFDNTGTKIYDTDGTFCWTDSVGLRASTCEPLFNVSHELSVSLTIQYDLETGGVAKEKLNFNIPLTFANVAERVIPPPPQLILASDLAIEGSPSFPPLLPSYSQLYHRNGERKIDYSVPLPLYTPKDGDPQSDVQRHPPMDDEKHSLPVALSMTTQEGVQA